jgi:hypothetical protein
LLLLKFQNQKMWLFQICGFFFFLIKIALVIWRLIADLNLTSVCVCVCVCVCVRVCACVHVCDAYVWECVLKYSCGEQRTALWW